MNRPWPRCGYECGNSGAETSLDEVIQHKKTEIADVIYKHGGKMGEELKAEGK
ncbi:MAG: hypothetical protein QGI86_15485 [Candidatus Poribacteria bacterium]|nr:hypothetical protein [Candidatus Poribacteria bacterium]